MRRTLLATALAAVLALSAAAGADASRFVVRGHGHGHGIGMSQWGAYGFARHHWTYDQILAHYYSGTGLGIVGPRTVRVVLQSGRRSISFDGATAASGKPLSLAARYVARSTSRGIVVHHGKHKVGTFAPPLSVSSSRGFVRLLGPAQNGVSAGWYRGAIEIGSGGGLMAVNALGLDDYARGVVSGEEPSSWPIEALKAQAVAARSYALTTNRGGLAFDQYPDTRSQVYLGVAGETAATDAAVAATKRQVVIYGNQIATTYFFDSSGGHTENVENVFYDAPPEPYLRGVADPYDATAPQHRWTLTFARAQMQARLGRLVKGRFRGIRVVKRGTSPRIVWADVIGSRGRTRVRGATLKDRLGLLDTWASFSNAAKAHGRPRPRVAAHPAPQTSAAAPVAPMPVPARPLRRAPARPSWAWPAATWQARFVAR